MQYKMTHEQFQNFVAARKADKLPAFWRSLGEALGFDPATVEAVQLKPFEYFTATPR